MRRLIARIRARMARALDAIEAEQDRRMVLLRAQRDALAERMGER